jgi:hypothetical protein
MLLGLDHVIIAVRDLAGAMKQLERSLGVAVTPGGDHLGDGTYNAIVRFGIEYLELISVRDPKRAAANERGQGILDFLRRGDGLLGFALGTDDMDGDMKDIASRNLRLAGPMPGSRRRPDGSLMTWRRSAVGNDLWGHTFPFLIQHDTPPQERRQMAPAAGHPLRVTGVPLLSVAVAELDPNVEAYRHLLGEPPEVEEEVPALPARRARFAVEGFHLELLQPASSSGGLADFVRSRGDGLFLVTLSVPDIDKAVEILRERGTEVGDPTPRRRAPLLNPSQTLGTRFQLMEER